MLPRRLLPLLCLVLLTPSTQAAAQVRLAEITGTVTDASGGILPGVTVTALHVDTGQQRATATEARGTYLITALPVGRYRLSAELQGFRGVVFENLQLEIGNSLWLDVRLQVASVEESVTVSGEAPLLDTTKSDLSGRINQRQVEELPLSGRNWMNLAALERRRVPENAALRRPGTHRHLGIELRWPDDAALSFPEARTLSRRRRGSPGKQRVACNDG